MPLPRRLAAEGVGSALLLAAIVGSGIMGDRLSGGNVAIALLANSIATGAALVALIMTFGAVSGAHFNPVVTLMSAATGRLPWADAGLYVLAQLGGACAGVVLAHAMFGLPLVQASQHARSGPGQVLSEAVATFGLVSVIRACSRHRPESVPIAAGAYITAAFWFTASTSFANPAVTVARTLTDSFASIRAVDAAPFVAAQLAGAAVATMLSSWLSR